MYLVGQRRRGYTGVEAQHVNACGKFGAQLYVRLTCSTRQHTSAYVSMHQHSSAYVSMRQNTSAYVSIRQHTSAYVSIRQHVA